MDEVCNTAEQGSAKKKEKEGRKLVGIIRPSWRWFEMPRRGKRPSQVVREFG